MFCCKLTILLTILVSIFILSSNAPIQIAKVLQYKTYPHAKNCYTQGLFFLNETHIFESCGYYGKSYYRVLKYENRDGQFKAQQTFKSALPIQNKVFLQGATLFQQTNKIYILTWQQKKVYKINRLTFQIEDVLKWNKDGWGLTSNKTHMFVTTGQATIYIVDQDFNIVDKKQIKDHKNNRVYSINELQYVVENDKSFIYANVYLERRIIKIDVQLGKVVRQFDMYKLVMNEKNLKGDEVINGIAYHQPSKKFILTGKNWGNFYLVDLY